jgi:hypothetical protein
MNIITRKQSNELFNFIIKFFSWVILISSNAFLYLFFKDILNGGNSYHLHILTFSIMVMVSHFIRYAFINRY